MKRFGWVLLFLPSLSFGLSYDAGNLTGGPESIYNKAITPSSLTNVGTGATFVIQNGIVSQLLDTSFLAQSSGWTTTGTKDYTLAQSTSGTNGNAFFTNWSGDYGWNFHCNLAAGSDGSMCYVYGLHNDNNFGVFGVTDVADAHLIKLYHRNSTLANPMIELEAETDWYSDYTAGLTPTFSGSFTGTFMRGMKRNVTQFTIDNDGSFYSYADSGNDYVRMYTIANTAGVLRANLPVSRWDEVTGSYIDFSPSLAGNLLTTVTNGGIVSVTPSGGEYRMSGNFTKVGIATQTIAAGNTITADSCGGTKRISSGGSVTTDTTNSFTFLTLETQCQMSVCNVGANTITIDRNARTFLAAAGDLALAANSCASFVFDGGIWRQVSAALTAT